MRVCPHCRQVWPEPQPTAAPVVFPTVGAVTTWSLTPEQFSQVQACFPHVDLLTELAKAKLWLEMNPTKRKTAKGMGRFLLAWVGRAVDKGTAAQNGHLTAQEAPRGTLDPKVERLCAAAGIARHAAETWFSAAVLAQDSTNKAAWTLTVQDAEARAWIRKFYLPKLRQVIETKVDHGTLELGL